MKTSTKAIAATPSSTTITVPATAPPDRPMGE